MFSSDVGVVLVHGAWADGFSWSKTIGSLAADGIRAAVAPLPLNSFQEDVAALDRALERAPEAVVLAGHACAGAVMAAARSDKVTGSRPAVLDALREAIAALRAESGTSFSGTSKGSAP